MIIITKQGEIKKQLFFQCPHCKCEFTCDRTDAKEKHFTIVRTMYGIDCPWCGNMCWHTEYAKKGD